MSCPMKDMVGKTWATRPPLILSLLSGDSRQLKKLIAAALFAAAACSAQETKTSYHFDFGHKAEAQSLFEAPSDIKYEEGFVTSDKPFFLSLPVPEGNYKVTVKLGDRHGTSTTTVKAELRRLMVEH